MCGIFGYAGTPIDAARTVFDGLKKLEYRGYDSWGVAVGVGGEVHTVRDVGKLTAPPRGLPEASLALGHTRWATTGAVTERNAHPHGDCTGRLSVVHNGIIENHDALRAELQHNGHRFDSETDTEVAAHLLEEQMAMLPAGPGTLAEALRLVSLKLHGLNALAALDAASGELAAVKNGSPLIVGLDGRANYLASDMAAILAHTRRLVYIQDGQSVSVRSDAVHVFDAVSGRAAPFQVDEVTWTSAEAELGRYRHYLEKEIWEQPELLRRIAATGDAQAQSLARFLNEGRSVHLVGCGTAFHAAMIGRHLLTRACGRSATSTYAHEFAGAGPLVDSNDRVLALSQSGETIDVLDAARAGRAAGAGLAALVNVPGSTLAREADLSIMLGAGAERSVLSTKTFVAKLGYLLMTCAVMANGFPGADSPRGGATLVEAAEEMEAMRADGRRDIVQSVARRIVDAQRLFVLGRGAAYPLALEAALKIKEASYIHAEGFAAGELKHGVIALVEPGTPVLVFAPEGPDEAQMLSSAGEVKARGAYVIGIGPRCHDVFDAHLPVQATGLAYLLSAIVPAQVLAYELALLRGADPDRPRNLAKSVTVR